MLWGRNSRFTSKNIFHASPDPLTPTPDPQATIVNFTALLRSQLKSSSSMFRASSLWAENSLELPVSSPQRQKASQSQATTDKGASKKKKAKKLKKKAQDRMLESSMYNDQEFIIPRIMNDDDSQDQMYPESPSPQPSSMAVSASAPVLRPSKLLKKKIYVAPYIDDKMDIPGPGTYNIATSLIKASHNKVYTSPPPINHTPHTHVHMPNYLKHTAASLYKDEKDRDNENDAVAAENSHVHTSSVYITLPTHHPANASKRPRKKRPGHTAHPSSHPNHPAAAAAATTSPICPHYPPVIAKCIWESEAHRGGRSGRKARDLLAAGSSGKNAKEKVVPF
eukprot:gene28631-34564_t